MAVATAITCISELVAAIGAVKSAKSAADAANAVGKVGKKVQDLRNLTAASLTAFGRQSNIMGRVYIEDSIAQDDIAIPLMGVLNQMYICWIITALGLDSMCADGRTVRDRLQLVAGEGFVDDMVDAIKNSFGTNKVVPSTESKLMDMDSDTQRLACGRLIELDFNIGNFSVNGNDIETNAGKIDPKTGNVTISPKTMSASQASLLKVYMYVQMIPYIMQQSVAAGFMGVNFAPTLSTRWKQLRAGEISFVKDFIFARDLIKKQAQLLKQDNTGMVAEMMVRQRNKLFQWATGLTGILPERHNLANAILIMNKNTFDQSCRDAHVDFNNRLTREQFFFKTFSMVMVVVDPMYGNVQMYFAGIPAVATYSYAMLNKVGAKGKDSFDLKEIMTALAAGQTPRF